MDDARFVWVAGEARINDHAYFRLDVELDGAPLAGVLHCFADSHYLLRVNGRIVNQGPARGVAGAQLHDSHDLAPWLRPGRNTIAVHCFHAGYPTFHHLLEAPAFRAWGEVRGPRGAAVTLATPGAWRCRRATGYDRGAPRWSFTMPSVGILDQRAAVPCWDTAPMDADWQEPVPLPDQGRWGTLRPRGFALPTQDERLPTRLLGAYDHVDDERIHAFHLPLFDLARAGIARDHCAFVATWLHSPRSQRVRCGRFWGEYVLNGRPLVAEASPRCWRSESELDLQAGWNLLVGHYGLVHDTWDFHLGLPASAGVELSAHRRRADAEAFLVAGPFLRSDPRVLPWTPAQLDPARVREALPDLPWTAFAPAPPSPCTAMGWAAFGADLGLPSERVADLRTPAGGRRSFILDLGGTVIGRVEIGFVASAGTVIDLGYAEELENARPHLDKNVIMHPGERVVAAGGPSTFDSYVPRGFRYLQLSVMAGSEEARIERVRVVEQRHPHRAVGSFRCSDPVLTRLWEMGWRTLQVCSEDVYTDTPWRERTLYAYDLLPEFATALATSGDTALVKRSLELLIAGGLSVGRAPAKAPAASASDNAMVPLAILEWYVRVTGDLEFARTAWPQVRAIVDAVEAAARAGDGLLDGVRAFIDHAGLRKQGAVCALQAVAAAAVERAAVLAASLGESATADGWRRLAERLREAVARFWLDEPGAFADAIVAGAPSAERFPTSSYWASCWGCATPEQDRRLLAFLSACDAAEPDVEREPLGSSFAAFYLLGALYRAGHVAFAEHVLRRHYGHMCDGGDTLWEHFHPRKSRSHAWSTAPTYYASTRILGVRLGFPEPDDLDGILIAPQAEGIDWADGVVPHPRGAVRIGWRVDGARLLMDVVAPAGVAVRIEPQGRLASLALVVNGGAGVRHGVVVAAS